MGLLFGVGTELCPAFLSAPFLGIEGKTAAAALWGCGLLLIRVLVVCTVFWPLFSVRAIGAGDIKMMAVCFGILGMERGLYMVFFSFFVGAVSAFWRMARQGILYERYLVFAKYVSRLCREGRLQEYEDRRTLHLGPCLLVGYCLMLILYK